MILHTTNKNKITLLIIFTIIFTALIFWFWLKFKPTVKIEALPNNALQEIVEEPKEYIDQAKDSLEQGAAELEILQDEIQKQEKQTELLDKTREYLDNKEQ